MKKFFGIGLLALLATAYLTSSCSRDEFDGTLLEAKAEAFSNAFKEVYGDPDPQHTWGFGDNNSTRAFTRAFSNYLNQEGANTNKNQWGDPNYFNLQIPPALTDGQKERVRKYFQTHKPLTYVDPHYTHFFIQQVYKGGTSPDNNPIMGNYTTEKYVMADANVNNGVYDQTIGSNKMDYLTVGLDANGNAKHHVNDFNNGEWNNGNKIYVLNEGESTNNYSEWYDNGHVHQDQITLMINSNTQKVGYANSTGSIQHNNACALVNPKDIDDWANAQTPVIGENVYYNIVDANNNVIVDNQKWTRSFVGLDFEGNDPYAYDNNGQKIAPKVGDVTNSVKFVWDGTRYYEFNDEMKAKTLKEVLGLTKDIYYLNDQTSKYAGKSSHFGSQADIESSPAGSDIRANLLRNGYTEAQVNAMTFNTNEKVLDLTKILPKINANCMPRQGESFMKWYYDFEDRGRDGIYSDWIVTLTKAKEIGDNSDDTPSEGTEDINVQRIIDGRIFCEDLGSADRTDIDFNDVVFDAFTYVTDTYEVPYTLNNGNKVYNWNNKLYKSTTYNKTDINLLAAGGTIDIQVAQQDVNTLLGIGKTTMANTYVEGASPDLSHTSTRDGVSPYKFTLNSESYTDLRNIPISVKQGNQVRELSANIGDVPQKFRAPVGTPWLVERRAIDYGYLYFRNWVESEQQTGEPWNFMTYDYLYHVKFISNNDVNQLGGTIADYGIDWERVAMKVNGETPITITLNETLQEGDQIAITGYRDQTDNATGTLYIKFNGSAVAQTQNFNNKAFNPNGIETKENTFVFTVTSATAGNDGFQLTKDTSGAEIYITSITVIGGLGAQRGETTSDDSTPVTPMDPEGQGEEEESDPTVTAPTNPTWSGTQAFTVDGQGRWSGQVQIDGNYNDFNNMGNGTYIRIYGYGTSNDWQVQLARQQVANPWTWTDMTNVYHQWGSTVNTSTTIEFGPLPADSARAVITDGKLVVLGKNFVVKYVKIDNSQVSSGSSVSGPFFSAIPTAAWSVPASTTNAQIGSSYATITGGKMYVTNGQTDARDLIKNQGGEWAFQHTNNNTFFKVELYNALQAGDVISVRMQSRTDTNLGLFFSTATSRPSSATAQIVLPQASAQAWTDGLTYTVAAGDGICGVKTFYIYRAEGKSTYFNSFAITRH